MVGPLHNLDGEDVEGTDELAPLRQVGHTRLQQHQHDNVDQVVQHLHIYKKVSLLVQQLGFESRQPWDKHS